jgi:hypothetical protein
MTFKSVIALCIVLLCCGFFTLDFLKRYTRYDFLVKGDVCIALDRQEDAIKVVSVSGCLSIPLTKSVEDKMRDQLEIELSNKIQAELAASRQANMMPPNMLSMQAMQTPTQPTQALPTLPAQ